MLAERFTDKLRDFCTATDARHVRQHEVLAQRRQKLVSAHRLAREKLRATQTERLVVENKARASNLPTGLKALWFRVTGRYKKVKIANEAYAMKCEARDRQESQLVIESQLRERRVLQHEFLQLRYHHEITMKKLNHDLGAYLELSGKEQETTIERQSTRQHRRKRTRQRHDL